MTTRAGRPERSVDEAKVRRATIAAAIGNTVETYDYAVYGFLAAVLGKLFFPARRPARPCCPPSRCSAPRSWSGRSAG